MLILALAALLISVNLSTAGHDQSSPDFSIEELADKIVAILKIVVLDLAKSNQFTKETLANPDHKAEVMNVLEEKINSAELRKNMDRIKRRDPAAQTAPSLIYGKLLQTVQGQLGDDPRSAEVMLQAAVTTAVKNYIVKQEPVQ